MITGWQTGSIGIYRVPPSTEIKAEHLMSRIGTTAGGRWSDKSQSGRTAQIEGRRRQRRQVEVERDPRELEGGQAAEKTGG